MSDDDKLYSDLWIKQSDIFIKLVALVPVAELALAASWYTLAKAGDPQMAQLVAGVGVIAMLASLALMWRTVEYVGHFRKKIAHLLPEASKSPITGRNAGVIFIVLCIAINAILATGCIQVTPRP